MTLTRLDRGQTNQQGSCRRESGSARNQQTGAWRRMKGLGAQVNLGRHQGIFFPPQPKADTDQNTGSNTLGRLNVHPCDHVIPRLEVHCKAITDGVHTVTVQRCPSQQCWQEERNGNHLSVHQQGNGMNNRDFLENNEWDPQLLTRRDNHDVKHKSICCMSPFLLFKRCVGASLVAQWLRICLPMQGTRVRALLWEDPTCRRATEPVHHNY